MDNSKIKAGLLTTTGVSDDWTAEKLLDQIEQTIIDFTADGAHKKRKVNDSLNAHSPDEYILISPRVTIP